MSKSLDVINQELREVIDGLDEQISSLEDKVGELEDEIDDLGINATALWEMNMLDDLLYSIGLGDWRTGYSVGEIDEIKKAICEVRGIYV